MSDWRPSLLAATIVLFGGGFVGAVTADRSPSTSTTASRTAPRTTAEPMPVAPDVPGNTGQTSTSAAPSSGIELTPPAGAGAPDTLTQLYSAGQIDGFDIDVGTQTIAGQTYEDGVSMATGRSANNGFNFGIELPIETKGRYTRLRGVVGIDGNTTCRANDASVSIVDDQDNTLWGPNRVSFTSAKRFNIVIKDLPIINLVQRSLASPGADNCGDDEDEGDLAYPAWGQVEFVK